jgi:hypothetical protein
VSRTSCYKLAYPSLSEARNPWPAADCLPGVVAEADNKEREHDSRSSTSMARPNTNGARHLRARACARVRDGAITLPSTSSKSANLEVHTSTTARGARTLEGDKIVISMQI